jgi:hypothetical protein
MLGAAGLDIPAIEEFLTTLGSMLGAVEMANAFEGKGGAPPTNTELNLLMFFLAEAFEKTGRQADEEVRDRGDYFVGDFFEAAKLLEAAASSATQRQAKSDAALGRMLQRMFVNRKEGQAAEEARKRDAAAREKRSIKRVKMSDKRAKAAIARRQAELKKETGPPRNLTEADFAHLPARTALIGAYNVIRRSWGLPPIGVGLWFWADSGRLD